MTLSTPPGVTGQIQSEELSFQQPSDSHSAQLHVCVDSEPRRGQRPAGVSGPQGGGGPAVNLGAETGWMEAGRGGGGGGRRADPEYVFSVFMEWIHIHETANEAGS